MLTAPRVVQLLNQKLSLRFLLGFAGAVILVVSVVVFCGERPNGGSLPPVVTSNEVAKASPTPAASAATSVIPSALEKEMRSIVQIRIDDSSTSVYPMVGSGVYMGGGYILTNYHVAELAIKDPDHNTPIICITRNMQSSLDCGFRADAYLVRGSVWKPAAFSEKLDLAVLNLGWRLDANGEWQRVSSADAGEFESVWGFKPIQANAFGRRLEDVSVGDKVQTLGFPGAKTLTYSEGVVTRFWETGNREAREYSHNVELIGADAEISEGSSGGAAFDGKVAWLGVTMGTQEDEVGQFQETGIIPVNVVSAWWKSLGLSATSTNI